MRPRFQFSLDNYALLQVCNSCFAKSHRAPKMLQKALTDLADGLKTIQPKDRRKSRKTTDFRLF